jgi:hypothetical protein
MKELFQSTISTYFQKSSVEVCSVSHLYHQYFSRLLYLTVLYKCTQVNSDTIQVYPGSERMIVNHGYTTNH